MTKYEMNQKLEIFNLTDPKQAVFNGSIVVVLTLPGLNPRFPEAYGVLLNSGDATLVHQDNLRPYPPALSGGRKDLDTKTSWAEFDTATGLDSSKFRKD